MSKSFLLHLTFLLVFLPMEPTNSSSLSVLPTKDDFPIDKPANDWFNKLVFNLIGYSIILIPINVLVFMVKNQIMHRSFQNLPIIRIFIYGKEIPVIQDDEEMQSMIQEDSNAMQMSKKAHLNGKKVQVYTKNGKDDTLLSNVGKLAYCFLGLQISYLTWGVLQEKIMTTEYRVAMSHSREASILASLNEKGELVAHFRDSQFLVLVNRVLAFVFAIIGILFYQKRHTPKPLSSEVGSTKIYAIAPVYEFIYCSLSNILSSWCQYEALKFVNFPTQVLSKACKILPVMLMSQIVGGKRYKFMDYFLALSISCGMSLFLYGNQEMKSNNRGSNHASYRPLDGILILILYLTFDSFTSNWQGKLFEKYKISTWQMMAAINFYSLLLTFTSLTEQGDLLPAFQILWHSSSLAWDCLLLSFCSAAGQLFVYYTISRFGPLIFVTIMTLRQAFAILLSCFIYGHSLTFISVIGIIIVFCTLFTQIYIKTGGTKKRSETL